MIIWINGSYGSGKTQNIAFASDKEEQSGIHNAEDWFLWVKQWEQQLKGNLEVKKQ